jgi:hypothetical protein
MLVVESDDPPIKRIRAPKLLAEVEKLTKKCSDAGYCLDPCPRETAHTPLTPVEAPLNDVALGAIRKNHMEERLGEYSGRTRSANRRPDPPEL